MRIRAKRKKSLHQHEEFLTKRLHALGKIQKQGTWVPYDLKSREVERRFIAYQQLLERQKRKGFFHRIVTGMKNGFIKATQ